jgi:hypothetical protein
MYSFERASSDASLPPARRQESIAYLSRRSGDLMGGSAAAPQLRQRTIAGKLFQP